MVLKRSLTVFAVLVLLATVAAACGVGTEETPTSVPPPATSTPAPTPLEKVLPAATIVPAAPPTTVPTSTSKPKPTATPTPTVVAKPAIEAPGIVDAANLGWPRSVSTKRGIVEIKERPSRVVTPSLGHSEILVSLADPSRIAGIGKYAYDPDFSNVLEIAESMPGKSITRDAERILSIDADLVIVSAFAPVEFIEQLEAAEVTVVQTEFDDSVGAIADNVRLMAYILGEVERGERIVAQVERRLQFIADTIGVVPEAQKPGVLLLGYLSKWTGGTGTSNEDIITLAGGVNLPSREFEGFQEIGDEAVFVMDPEVILLSADEVRDKDALNLFLNNPALAQVDAISNEDVYGVERRYLWNLSHWRVRGVEEVAKILYPEQFSDTEFGDFEIQPN